MSKKQEPKKKGLTDAELIAKYDTGGKVNFDKALKAMCKVESRFGSLKTHHSKKR